MPPLDTGGDAQQRVLAAPIEVLHRQPIELADRGGVEVLGSGRPDGDRLSHEQIVRGSQQPTSARWHATARNDRVDERHSSGDVLCGVDDREVSTRRALAAARPPPARPRSRSSRRVDTSPRCMAEIRKSTLRSPTESASQPPTSANAQHLSRGDSSAPAPAVGAHASSLTVWLTKSAPTVPGVGRHRTTAPNHRQTRPEGSTYQA